MLPDSAILKHIARQPKRSAGFKQLVRELGLHGEARGELDTRLQKLVAAGELVQINSDRYALPQSPPDKNLVAGRLTMHRDGFGFVIPDASSLSPSIKSRLLGDIFIAPHAIGNAMHGDRVLVDIVATRPDGRAEGRIVRSVVRSPSHRGGNFSLRQPPQLCEADRQQNHPGDRDSAGHGNSRSQRQQRINGAGQEEISRPRARETRPRATRTGTISKAWWSMSKSPTGPRPRRILAAASSKSSAARTTSASTWKLPSASFICLTTFPRPRSKRRRPFPP